MSAVSRGDQDLRAPGTYVSKGTWPDAQLTGPPVVRYAQDFSRSLRDALGTMSLRQLARDASLSHSTLVAILSGQRWPDGLTIAKLEEALGSALWTGPHPKGWEAGPGEVQARS